MVWGCISQYGFHDLVLLDGRVDAIGYTEVLQDRVLGTYRIRKLSQSSMDFPAR
jgi:hypothetical protein